MIEYAGVPLLMEDPEGVLRDFLARFLPTAETTLFSAPIAWGDTTRSFTGRASTGLLGSRVGVPIPNYPPPPPLRLNSLYWPTGAARWSRMLCLATEEAKDRIVAAVRGGTRFTEVSAAQLVLGPSDYAEGQQFGGNVDPDAWSSDQSGRRALSTAMYLLPPRCLADTDIAAAGGDAGRLWLLPLVDVRWFWQWRHVETAIAGTDPWATWVAAWAADMGVTLTPDPIAAEYEAVQCAHDLTHLPAAVAMDAVSHSLSRRFVRDVDGTCRLDSSGGAAGWLTGNLEAADWIPWDLAAGGGGDTRMVTVQTPQAVDVCFDSYGFLASYLRVTHLAEDFDLADYQSGLTKTFRVPTQAYLRPLVDGQLELSTAETDLALRIAEDFYAWRHVPHDRTFAGLKRWTPNGFDDHVEWSWGRLVDGEYLAQTRAQGVPLNFGVDELMLLDPEGVEDACPFANKVVLFELKETLSEGGPAADAPAPVAAEAWRISTTTGERGSTFTVWTLAPGNSTFGMSLVGMFGGFRGMAFGADDELSTDPEASAYRRGDAVWATQLKITITPEEGDPYTECVWFAVGGGRQTIRGLIDVEGDSGSVADGEEGYLLVTDDNPSTGTGWAQHDGRVWRVPVTFETGGSHGEARAAEWDSSQQRWYVRSGTGGTRTFVEVQGLLIEGGEAVQAWVLDESFARTATEISVDPGMANVGSSLAGVFRGVAFEAQGTGTGERGDIVEVVAVGEDWYALGSGATAITGTIGHAAAAGATVTVTVDTEDSRTITVTGRAQIGRAHV